MKILKYQKFLESKESEIAQICERFRIENWHINGEGLVDVEGDVDICDIGLTEIPIKFGKVEGYFDCSYNKLTSLEGSPEIVEGYFNCQLNKLTSLEGGPKIVSSDFYCHRNQLTSLKGGPKIVIGSRYWLDNNQIRDLDGFPEFWEGNILYHGNPIYPILNLFPLDKVSRSINLINEFEALKFGKANEFLLEQVFIELGLNVPSDLEKVVNRFNK